MGRATQGVKIIRLRDEDSIASVAQVSKWEKAEEVLLDEDGNVIETTEEVEGETAVEETNESNDNEDQSEDTDNNLDENTNENN
jgi:DNA gyrase subunit A